MKQNDRFCFPSIVNDIFLKNDIVLSGLYKDPYHNS